MPGPLDGVRVFDLTLFMVGPWAGMQLGAMGADVIHAEEPGSIHGSRIWVPPSMKGTSVGYIVWNLNKRGMLLDLKQEQDRNIAYRIVETSDVFLENMRPGAVERLGMGYEKLAALNDRLVYVSGSGFGRKGPMAGMPGNDTVAQCVGASCSVNGQPGEPFELYRHHTQMDATTGNYMVQAALLGLLARDTTGRGQRIDVSMLGASTALQATRMAEYFATGEDPPRLGSASATTAPHQAFRCQDGQYVAVGVIEEAQWGPFCEEVGLPDLAADPRFDCNRRRVESRTDLVALLEPVFLTKPCYHWVTRLTRRGVPAGPFHHWDELRHHAQVTENQQVLQLPTPWGEVYAGGPPWKFSETPTRVFSSPEPGQHMAEVLEEIDAATAAPAD